MWLRTDARLMRLKGDECRAFTLQRSVAEDGLLPWELIYWGPESNNPIRRQPLFLLEKFETGQAILDCLAYHLEHSPEEHVVDIRPFLAYDVPTPAPVATTADRTRVVNVELSLAPASEPVAAASAVVGYPPALQEILNRACGGSGPVMPAPNIYGIPVRQLTAAEAVAIQQAHNDAATVLRERQQEQDLREQMEIYRRLQQEQPRPGGSRPPQSLRERMEAIRDQRLTAPTQSDGFVGVPAFGLDWRELAGLPPRPLPTEGGGAVQSLHAEFSNESLGVRHTSPEAFVGVDSDPSEAILVEDSSASAGDVPVLPGDLVTPATDYGFDVELDVLSPENGPSEDPFR